MASRRRITGISCGGTGLSGLLAAQAFFARHNLVSALNRHGNDESEQTGIQVRMSWSGSAEVATLDLLTPNCGVLTRGSTPGAKMGQARIC